MASVAQPKVVANVMLAAGAADKVMNLQPPSLITLGPPANGTASVVLHPFQQRITLGLVHGA
jgi:hypothetical protein